MSLGDLGLCRTPGMRACWDGGGGALSSAQATALWAVVPLGGTQGTVRSQAFSGAFSWTGEHAFPAEHRQRGPNCGPVSLPQTRQTAGSGQPPGGPDGTDQRLRRPYQGSHPRPQMELMGTRRPVGNGQATGQRGHLTCPHTCSFAVGWGDVCHPGRARDCYPHHVELPR